MDAREYYGEWQPPTNMNYSFVFFKRFASGCFANQSKSDPSPIPEIG